MKTQPKIPQVIVADDYHTFDSLERAFRLLDKNIRVAEFNEEEEKLIPEQKFKVYYGVVFMEGEYPNPSELTKLIETSEYFTV